MKGLTHPRARIGILRMNRVIEMARAEGALTIKVVAAEFDCYEQSAKKYLQRLVDLGLMTERPMLLKNSIRKFELVPGAQLLEVPEPKQVRPSVKKPRRPIVVDEYCRRVFTVPAAQVGMQRDPLVQALFGDRRAG
jgi:hypothetical protein